MAILLAQVPGGWKAKTALAELYDIPEEYAELVCSYVPNFSYFVIDLNEMRSDEIKGNILVRTVMELFKAFIDGRLEDIFDKIEPMLSGIMQEKDAGRILYGYLQYILSVDSGIDSKPFKAKMDLIQNDKIKLKAMNILEQLVAEKNESVLEKLVAEGREQGELIGREQGELEGEQKVLIETVQP